MKLFVTGEGPAEIGKWSESPEYRNLSKRTDGVLAELFRTRREGTVIGGVVWKDVRKYRVGQAHGDTRTLQGAALLADEAGAEVLLWARDSDGSTERVNLLEAAHAQLKEERADLEIIGGLPEKAIEAWIIAIAQLLKNPESLSRDAAKTLVRENDLSNDTKMCELIKGAPKPLDTSRSPSLAKWMAQL
ncbi:MAG: hypothetical protein JNM17_25575 [Archangium sp.]|nr:hypothetical protein [Archangium sp.]